MGPTYLCRCRRSGSWVYQDRITPMSRNRTSNKNPAAMHPSSRLTPNGPIESPARSPRASANCCTDSQGAPESPSPTKNGLIRVRECSSLSPAATVLSRWWVSRRRRSCQLGLMCHWHVADGRAELPTPLDMAPKRPSGPWERSTDVSTMGVGSGAGAFALILRRDGFWIILHVRVLIGRSVFILWAHKVSHSFVDRSVTVCVLRLLLFGLACNHYIQWRVQVCHLAFYSDAPSFAER